MATCCHLHLYLLPSKLTLIDLHLKVWGGSPLDPAAADHTVVSSWGAPVRTAGRNVLMWQCDSRDSTLTIDGIENKSHWAALSCSERSLGDGGSLWWRCGYVGVIDGVCMSGLGSISLGLVTVSTSWSVKRINASCYQQRGVRTLPHSFPGLQDYMD